MECFDRARVQSDRSEFYREFAEFIRQDVESQRRVMNRRMFSVFVWCFIMPAIAFAAMVILIKSGLVPRFFRRYLDWLIVFFPVAYALYVLAMDFLGELPTLLRRGGMSVTMARFLEEESWRSRVCQEMRQRFVKKSGFRDQKGWRWLVKSFAVDLQNLQQRTRYLTALAGAVFYLLMQGIDFLDDKKQDFIFQPTEFMNWVESSSTNVAQFIGLGIFLILFYLSGNQVHTSLFRYLQCAELVLEDLSPDNSSFQPG